MMLESAFSKTPKPNGKSERLMAEALQNLESLKVVDRLTSKVLAQIETIVGEAENPKP